MKARLNITIEESLLESVKTYAVKKQSSVSELVETYFKTVTKPSRRKNILQLVEKLEKPAFTIEGNLNEVYFKENAKKYGF
ncbi:MAG: DUF6364 family protein [Bacteroidota bacterium]